MMEKMEKDITSSAYKESETIKGQGDAQATKIYREAYAKNPEFYAFYKALESLELIISKDGQVFLTTDNDILRLLKNIPK